MGNIFSHGESVLDAGALNLPAGGRVASVYFSPQYSPAEFMFFQNPCSSILKQPDSNTFLTAAGVLTAKQGLKNQDSLMERYF
jgi:hypothetical protein